METKICSSCEKEKSVKEFYLSVDNRDNKSYYSSICKVCKSIYAKHYRQNNKELISNRSKRYYEKNKNRINVGKKEYMKQWYEDHKEGYKQRYQDNKEYMKKQHKCYRENNKAKINASTAKRRSIKRNQTLDNVDKEKIMFMYKVAYEMTKEHGVEYQVDHIKPLSKGGLHHEDNLQILSRDLNLRKASKWPLTKEEKLLYAGVTIKNLEEIRQ